ncbi:MAG: siroheme synthase CysG [Pseudomonadota bacterium]
MKTFPMFLKMSGRRVWICGGGEQAAQKARLIAKTEAEIKIAAPMLCPELEAMVRTGAATHHQRPLRGQDLRGAALVFAASGCPGADAALVAVARDQGVVVNAVDMPDLCDAYTPAIVDRDPVVVAIGTEGCAPVLGRQIKSRVEAILEPGLGQFTAFAGALRARVAQRVPRIDHRAFWAWAFGGTPRNLLAQGEVDAAMQSLSQAVDAGTVPTDGRGSVALVGAGPGAQDLITLRGVKRLQEADVILYDRLVPDSILELARRDAERIYVGKAPGDACLPERWSQARINRLTVQLAQEGQRVVRLKSGDPGVFGRAEEELAACAAAGIPCELVPGITAASGALAEMGACQTERGEIDTMALVTGTDRHHGVPEALFAPLRPGTRLAIYMGTRNVAEIQTALLQHAPADLPVQIVEAATQPSARRVDTVLSGLADTVVQRQITAPAMILVSHPRSHATDVALRETGARMA